MSILHDALDYTTNSSWRVRVPVNTPQAAVVMWIQAGGVHVNPAMCGVQAQVWGGNDVHLYVSPD